MPSLTKGIGSIWIKPQNRRKNHPKQQKNFEQNQKPFAKPSKPIIFHIPVIKTLIDPIQFEISGDA